MTGAHAKSISLLCIALGWGSPALAQSDALAPLKLALQCSNKTVMGDYSLSLEFVAPVQPAQEDGFDVTLARKSNGNLRFATSPLGALQRTETWVPIHARLETDADHRVRLHVLPMRVKDGKIRTVKHAGYAMQRLESDFFVPSATPWVAKVEFHFAPYLKNHPYSLPDLLRMNCRFSHQ